jgi:hypothetical protein
VSEPIAGAIREERRQFRKGNKPELDRSFAVKCFKDISVVGIIHLTVKSIY